MKQYILLVVALVALLATSCHKNCRCYGYDGTVTDYSKSEVDEHGGSCPNMVYLYNTRYYSLCEWDD